MPGCGLRFSGNEQTGLHHRLDIDGILHERGKSGVLYDERKHYHLRRFPVHDGGEDGNKRHPVLCEGVFFFQGGYRGRCFGCYLYHKLHNFVKVMMCRHMIFLT
jgi:hypothetical protein